MDHATALATLALTADLYGQVKSLRAENAQLRQLLTERQKGDVQP